MERAHRLTPPPAPLRSKAKRSINDVFLPEETNMITWGSACLAEDTEIRLADGNFASLQHPIGK